MYLCTICSVCFFFFIFLSCWFTITQYEQWQILIDRFSMVQIMNSCYQSICYTTYCKIITQASSQKMCSSRCHTFRPFDWIIWSIMAFDWLSKNTVVHIMLVAFEYILVCSRVIAVMVWYSIFIIYGTYMHLIILYDKNSNKAYRQPTQ